MRRKSRNKTTRTRSSAESDPSPAQIREANQLARQQVATEGEELARQALRPNILRALESVSFSGDRAADHLRDRAETLDLLREAARAVKRGAKVVPFLNERHVVERRWIDKARREESILVASTVRAIVSTDGQWQRLPADGPGHDEVIGVAPKWWPLPEFATDELERLEPNGALLEEMRPMCLGTPKYISARVLCRLLDLTPAGKGKTALAFIKERCEQEIEPERLGPHLYVPRFQGMSDTEALQLPLELPRFLPDAGPSEAAQLPLFDDIRPAGGCPSWLLSLYDQASGHGRGRHSRGAGAPWALRLYVGALLSVPVQDRDGGDKRFSIPVGRIATWLHPGGWDRSNRRRDWGRFRAELRSLDQLRIVHRIWSGDAACPAPRIGCSSATAAKPQLLALRVVDVPGIPEEWDRGRALTVFRVSIPRSAARGARVDWSLLTRYGLESACLYRAYLSASAVLDHSARCGHAITRTIGAPVLDAAGNRKFKDGRPVRNRQEQIANPAARYVGFLSDDDLRRMVGLHDDHPQNRARARSAIERLQEDRVIEIERRADGCIRFFSPSHSSN